MAVTVLSPWPQTTAELAAAISALKDAIKPGAANATVERLGAVASVRVEQFASNAPSAIRSEALIRFAGYLLEAAGSGFGAIRGKSINLDSAVTLQRDSVTNHAAAFRNCGAMALLSPWKRRRAGAIGATLTTEEIMPSEQLSPVTLSEIPVNIADGYSAGKYQFQVSPQSSQDALVLYSYGMAAPSELDHYFQAEAGDLVPFTVVSGTRLWARVLNNEDAATIAIARL